MMHRVSRCALGACTDVYTQLLVFARRFVDANGAEDLVQEAFVRAMEVGRGDPRGLPLPYMKVIVRNLAFDSFAKRTRDRALNERAGNNEEPQHSPRREVTLEDDLRDRLAELSQRQWESLVMTVVHGLTENEAASAADVSRSAVAGSRDRALQWLRRSLPETGAKGELNRLAG